MSYAWKVIVCNFLRHPIVVGRFVVTEELPWLLAWMLPRKVALFAFIRVYGVLGRCGDDYLEALETWERGEGK